MVLSAVVPSHPDTPFANRIRPWDPKAPDILPQIAVGAEHYNRIVRMLRKGVRLQLEMKLQVEFTKPDSGYNVLAELPGSDLKDEIVMIGAHLDSWHAATGATDNGAGVAVCMEAMRILKKTGLQPRRTIRIGLWGGEEEGELGSKAFVKKYLGERITTDDGETKIVYKPEAEKFSVYFNEDNGTGRYRGIYMENNEAVRPLFRSWFAPFGDENSFTLTLKPTTNTDHQSFDQIGLPAFQFIQDEIEYFTRTWHSTMDLYERAIENDLKQSATIMAGFAYNAAMRNERLPGKAVQDRLHR
jgi:Zn-dependent M28 family amino/carboxypeptidase